MSNYHENTEMFSLDDAPSTLEAVDVDEIKLERNVVYIGSAEPTTGEWEAYLEEKYQCELNFKRDQLARLNLEFLHKEIRKNSDVNTFLIEQNLEHEVELKIAKTETNIMDARRQYHKYLPIASNNEGGYLSVTLKRNFEGRTKSHVLLKEKLEKIKAKHKEAREERKLRAKEK